MAKPRIDFRSVASSFAGADEKIATVTHPNGTGCLLSIKCTPDGGLHVEVYRADDGVTFNGPRPTHGNTLRSLREVPAAIHARRDFRVGPMWGRAYGHDVDITGRHDDTDRLRPSDQAAYERDRPYIAFLVVSYATPIAWYREDSGWRVVGPDVTPMTDRHRRIVARTLGNDAEGTD